MSVTQYSLGIAYLTITVTALALVGVSLRRRLIGPRVGAPARLAETIFALSALIVSAEMLGSVGLLTPAALLASLVVTAALSSRLARLTDSSETCQPTQPVRRWPAILAFLVAAVTVVHWTGGVQESLDVGMYRQDSTWYHLPLSAAIYQTGDTWSLRFTDPMALTAWFYPQNSELLHTTGMLALGRDFLSPLLNVGWLALALLAAWCTGRRFGRGPEALIAVAIVLDTPMMQMQAGNAPADVAGVALLLTTVAILLDAWDAVGTRPAPLGRRGGMLFAAGLAAGLAIGTKLTLLVPVAMLTLGLAWILGRTRPRLLGAWLCGVLATGGYWYLRNLVQAGNPLPWVSIGPLPGPDQVSLYPRSPHSVADYATDPGSWLHRFGLGLDAAVGPFWPLLLLAAAAGLVLAVVRGPGLHRLIGLAGIAAAVAYAFVPVSASGSPSHPSGFETNLRYLAPTLALGLAMLPVQLSGIGARARLHAPFLAAVFALGLIGSFEWWPQPAGPGTALVLLLVAAPLALAYAAPGGVGRLAAVAGTAFLLVVALGYPSQRDYLRARYRPGLAPAADNPGFRDTPQWHRLQAWARHTHDARIGLVGPPAAFGQYVFYDAALSNRVRYIGEPVGHGGYRPIVDCAAWRRAINRGEFEFVVVTPASAFGPSSVPQESLWMRGDPNAREVLRLPPAAVFRIDGTLDPRACRPADLPPVLVVPGGGFVVPPAH